MSGCVRNFMQPPDKFGKVAAKTHIFGRECGKNSDLAVVDLPYHTRHNTLALREPEKERPVADRNLERFLRYVKDRVKRFCAAIFNGATEQVGNARHGISQIVMESWRVVDGVLAHSAAFSLKAPELGQKPLVLGQFDTARIRHRHKGEIKLRLILLALLVGDAMLTKLTDRPLRGEPIAGY